ncbi:DUF2703 domain-containing protein [Candidatus Aminicenantes bacterium AC-708-M15]|jgi:glutaredoxin|nr:DUF2703 domain-containing protein [SCandidatus Aminicenantes bacterium Aminicenantia_JdfR_composite]MCP2604131.1 DUF2703 domain-containing protein [Candidatus Aminicenantes bacterium AC-708-M15]MCP2606272.1 DUF2703 domain-containing protein [Candidatus Aminicenantes bacterium AC-708-I09]MCP2617962.1 DUF2703 domain-containing protein [Candidatus Aminicenantes bacterium AC-335-A11]
MKIQLLYVRGCPHFKPALNLLSEILKEKGLKEKIELIEIGSEEEAKKYEFLGSPSIKINGKDIEKEKRGYPPSFGCRIYKNGENYTGVPPKRLILKAIEEEIKPK